MSGLRCLPHLSVSGRYGLYKAPGDLQNPDGCFPVKSGAWTIHMLKNCVEYPSKKDDLSFNLSFIAALLTWVMS